AVDDAVTRTQRDTTSAVDEVGQGMVGVDVDPLRVGRSVAERLHDQLAGGAQPGQVLQPVASQRAGGVPGADGGHLGFAVGAGADAFDATGATDHLLGQGEALVAVSGGFGLAEQVGGTQTQFGAGLLGQTATNDQRDTAASTYFV